MDVGGVLIRDFSGTDSWAKLLNKLGVTDENSKLFDAIWKKNEESYCLDYDIDTLLIELKTNGFGLKVDSLLDEFVKLFSKNEAILPLLEYAKDKYHLGIISNMYPRMYYKIIERDLLPQGYNWEVVVDSSVALLQKPQSEIFKLALERAEITAPQAIFVDNSIKHVDTARNIGMKAFLYDVYDPEKSAKNIISRLKEDNA